MKKSTLCFCVQADQVLLAMKKRGFGEGKWNGYGGKVEEGETPWAAAARELHEESGLKASESALAHVGTVRFYFAEKPIFECFVFLVHEWEGEPVETEEMRPQWYEKLVLPFADMWAADAKWIPLILAGEKIDAEVIFNEDGSQVQSFTYAPATFS